MDIKVTNVFKRNFESKATVVLNEGGARSSKSYSICQLFIMKFINEENKKFLITRKTLPSLRITAYKLFVDLLKQYGYYGQVEHNRTFREFKFKSNYLLATSLDESTKIQSTDFNYIWMEEAEEFSYDDYVTLKTRLSGVTKENEVNQMYLSYNPKREYGYINKKVKSEKNIEIIKSSYKDNTTLSADYIELLENLKEQSTDFYKIFTLGEYANSDGLIYQNFKYLEIYPEEYETVIYGLDFGYNNPSALVKAGIKDNRIYLTELLYETHLTNGDLIERLGDLIDDKRARLYCDTAEPDRIREIKLAGYNAIKSDKNITAGIDYVKRCEIYTNSNNVNLNKELEEYCYKKDRQGNILEEPVKYNSHLLDGVRYAVYTYNRRKANVNVRILTSV